eukprot:6648846-Prymnesium_polylepis.1
MLPTLRPSMNLTVRLLALVVCRRSTLLTAAGYSWTALESALRDARLEGRTSRRRCAASLQEPEAKGREHKREKDASTSEKRTRAQARKHRRAHARKHR